MSRKFSKLTLKLTVGLILLGVLICTSSSLIGYNQYKSSIERLYNTTAYDAAEVALSYLETDELKGYAETVKGYRKGDVSEAEIKSIVEGDRYRQIAGQLDSLRKAMGANDVFMFYLDVDELLSYDGDRENWKPLLYIFDSYTVPEYAYVLGDEGSFNPDYLDDLHHIGVTGERSDNYFFSKSDYGNNTAALLPVSADGEVVAIVAVEIPMVTLQSSLRQYILYAVLITIGIILVFICVYTIYLLTSVVRPINTIAAETARFIENKNKISDKLGAIKTHDEIEVLARGMLKMQRDINDYIDNLTQVTAEKERIGAELSVATHIQSSMLPCVFPAFPEHTEFDISASMKPAKEVGGDFYDLFLIDSDHVAVVIADVSGKGVPAALFMVITKTLIKNHAQNGESPREVLTNVNSQLCENNEEGMFVTAWMGVLEISTGKFVYANAGHNPPLVKKKDGEFEYLRSRAGFVLAGMDGIKYTEKEMILQEEDILYLYTDGVTESTDIGNRLYGENRLREILNRNGDKLPSELLHAVKEDVDAFAGEAPQFDDITMLVLKINKKPEGAAQ